jgi:6,7-dimethyl-8-ribityllumazine synthase
VTWGIGAGCAARFVENRPVCGYPPSNLFWKVRLGSIFETPELGVEWLGRVQDGDVMLTEDSGASLPSGSGLRIAIVASRYNSLYVDGMLASARETLLAAGAPEPEVVRVPGAWEIPVAAAALVRRLPHPPAAVICLGLILQGETSHADHIGEAVSQGLMRLALKTGVPMIHEVLTVTQVEQARVRCLDPQTNRGREAARTALEMGRLMGSLSVH